MLKIIIKSGLSLLLLWTGTIFVSGQAGKNKNDSLIELSKSTIDTVRLNALIKLTWNSRFTDPLQGFEYAFDGLAIAENLNRPSDIAILHNYIGVLATKINSFDKAKIHIQKAYRVADSLNLITQRAYALNNLGEIYYHTGKHDSAITPLKQAAEIFKSINDDTGLAYAYNQMGMALRIQKKYDEAFKYHNLSLELRKKLNHNDFVTKAYLNMGIDLLEKGDYVGARSQFELMDQKLLENRPYFSVPYQLILIGKTYQGENDINNAVNSYREAYNKAFSAKLYPELRDAAKLLSDLFNKQENHKTALHYFNSYKVWDDSVKNSDLVAEYQMLELRKAFDQKYRFLEYKMMQDIESQKLKLFWNRVLTTIFVVFFLILAILILILYRNFKTIASQNKLLLVQKADIESKNQELFAQNLQISEQNHAIISQRDELALANATKDKFFSIIAHDLRGPVGNLSAFFNLIMESYHDKFDEKMMEFFKVVNASVQQTYTLLENLLTWAQIQNGTIPFHPVSNNLFSIVDNNINLLMSKANQKNINIRNELPKELFLVFDTYMIDTVVRNILSNSIKFTHENGIILIKSETQGNMLQVNISDSGIGMAKNVIENMFRLDSKHKTKEGTAGEKGTGLGLILCKEFIEKHQGKIWVESQPGKGSTFSFTLPLQQ